MERDERKLIKEEEEEWKMNSEGGGRGVEDEERGSRKWRE